MDRQARIRQLAWERTARTTRGRIEQTLLPCLKALEFLELASTEDFGTRFWAKVEGLAPIDAGELEPCLKRLTAHSADSPIIWLHRDTSEAGAIRTSAVQIFKYHLTLMRDHGPDMLVATDDLAHGCAYDVSEHDVILKCW